MHRIPEEKHMEMDGDVEEEEKDGGRIPELAKDRKGEAKAGKNPEEEEDVERPRERHTNRIPVVEAASLSRTKEEEAKAVARKAKAALTVEVVRKITRSAASKICRFGAPYVHLKGMSSGIIRGLRTQ